ncbi:hypothetical protein CDAR_267921 [Caerostris darwini]|uniref:Uncharacterized protein n=1 Tax=Caerostris darwini TaxID=1538125 RepID=A0AAV4RLS2_9ARAC|nr:hypothetical protein CDAR_267921 [Caerostris darwini]
MEFCGRTKEGEGRLHPTRTRFEDLGHLYRAPCVHNAAVVLMKEQMRKMSPSQPGVKESSPLTPYLLEISGGPKRGSISRSRESMRSGGIIFPSGKMGRGTLFEAQ